MKERNNANRKKGKEFEKQLGVAASQQGIMAQRNGQEVRRLPGGMMIAVDSNLDWTLVYQGKVVFVDCKSFEGDSFTFSQIKEHQLELAAAYEKRGIVAGFVVLFRAIDTVCFFNGRHILQCGKRTKFRPENGMALGQASNMDLLALANLMPVI